MGSAVDITDGSTTVTAADKITFSGATVTDQGNNDALVTISGGGGGGVKQYAFLIQYGSNREVSNAKGSVTQLTTSPYSSDSVTITLSATTNELKLLFTTEDNPPQSVIGHYGAYAGYPNVKFNTVALNTGQNGYLIAEGVTATQTGGNADASDFIDDFSTVTYDLDVNPANYGGTEGADGFDTVFTQTYLVFSF